MKSLLLTNKVVNSYRIFHKTEDRAQSKTKQTTTKKTPKIRSLLSPVAWHRRSSDFSSYSFTSCWLLRMQINCKFSRFRNWKPLLIAFSLFIYAFFSGFVPLFFLSFSAVLPLIITQLHKCYRIKKKKTYFDLSWCF